MHLADMQFKRLFSFSMYKDMRISLGKMNFAKDFVNDKRGDLYPVLEKNEGTVEAVENNIYTVSSGSVKRYFCSFFPFATYELSFTQESGRAGFHFHIKSTDAEIYVENGELVFVCGEREERVARPSYLSDRITLSVSARKGAFDVFFLNNGRLQFFKTFRDEAFANSNLDSEFVGGYAALMLLGECRVYEVSSFVDNGVSIADIRTIRYEDGSVMTEEGRIYFTATVRMLAEMYQGVFSWIPGTAEVSLTGALFYDTGDGRWNGDVAASVLYNREKKCWYLWVCSFSHGHILGHAEFDGDIRFGVNVVDITLMEKAGEDAASTEFLGFSGDEDPDFFYDKEADKWTMSICRLDKETRAYRYFFFESREPFSGYKYIGKGLAGAETGGSFVKIDGEQYFVCGNDFKKTSDYRIYDKNGMRNASFDFADGGFRGWGTVIPVKQGSRTRYYWLTFDRHNASDYNWSYGNFYCFEAR